MVIVISLKRLKVFRGNKAHSKAFPRINFSAHLDVETAAGDLGALRGRSESRSRGKLFGFQHVFGWFDKATWDSFAEGNGVWMSVASKCVHKVVKKWFKHLHMQVCRSLSFNELQTGSADQVHRTERMDQSPLSSVGTECLWASRVLPSTGVHGARQGRKQEAYGAWCE